MRRLLAAGALCACLLRPAQAVFVQDEINVIDSERLFDTEYFLDLRSFSYPLEWQIFWDISTRGRGGGYRINAASLDRTDLYLDQDVSLRKPLTDWLAFRYRLDQYDTKDVESLHQWLDLEFGPFGGLTFGVFGEPTFDKENADMGFRLGYRPTEVWNLWASANAVDFNFNGRGKAGEAYARKPITYAFGADTPLWLGRMKARLELDMPLLRRTPSANRLYGYRRTRASVTWLLPPADDGGWHLLMGYGYGFKREQVTFTPDTTATSEDFHRQVHSGRLAGLRELTEVDNLEAGTEFLSRRGSSEFINTANSDLRHNRWEVMPYARWRRHVNSWSQAEVATFMSFGEKNRHFPNAPASTTRDSIVQAKLGLGWDFIFGGAGRIGLYSAFDLDDFPSYDGGNVRAMFLFN
jgi:hypothetical protein